MDDDDFDLTQRDLEFARRSFRVRTCAFLVEMVEKSGHSHEHIAGRLGWSVPELHKTILVPENIDIDTIAMLAFVCGFSIKMEVCTHTARIPDNASETPPVDAPRE